MDASTAIDIARQAYAERLEFRALDGDAPDTADRAAPFGAPPDYPRGCWIVSLVQSDRVGGTLSIVVRKRDGKVVGFGQVGE